MDKFTPDILGAFWITETDLSRELMGFDEFNYIFDGLISQYLYGKSNSEENRLSRSNVFYTNNFNQKLFLAHIKLGDDTKAIIDEQIALIQAKEVNRKKILIFNRTSINVIEDLTKRFPDFEFCSLELI